MYYYFDIYKNIYILYILDFTTYFFTRGRHMMSSSQFHRNPLHTTQFSQ
uniref:Uncharacterized protein n=1 Tax=Anguilla anguilla TaxID=7936 RepID=A0A0E9WRI3_ANGAN